MQPTKTKDDRGQVGIGTLIVFIAMVLVAAIAAGVLINTAGMLQSQAEATGEESTDLVSERIDITESVGVVDSSSDGSLEEIRVGVSASAGADDIDLTETIVQAVGPTGQENLVYDEEDDITELDDGDAFLAETTDGGTVGDSAVLGDEDDYTLVFNPAAEPFGADADLPDEGDSTLAIQNLDEATDSDNHNLDIEIASEDVDNENLDGTSETGFDPGTTTEVEFEDLPEGDYSVTINSDTDTDYEAVTFDVTVDDTQIEVDAETETGGDMGDPDGERTVTIDLESGIDDALSEGDITVDLLTDGDENSVQDDTSFDVQDGEYAVLIEDQDDPATFGTQVVTVEVDGEDVTETVTLGAVGDTFGEGDQATLDIVSPSGATTQVDLTAPDIFTSDDEAVRL